MITKMQIEIKVTGDLGNGSVTHKITVEIHDDVAPAMIGATEAVAQALAAYAEANKPGTSRNNPILLDDWSDLPRAYKSNNRHSYYATKWAPDKVLSVDEDNYIGEGRAFSLTVYLNKGGYNDYFFPLVSSNIVRTWKTLEGVARYITKHLAYWHGGRP